jgi:hypothetical protein
MVSVVVSLALLLALPVWAQEPAAIGLVKSTSGVVTLLRSQTSQPATPGMVLHEGDSLMTGDKASSVAVTLVDDTRLALGPRSRLVLRHFSWDATRQTGQMRAELPAGTLAVQSGLLGKRESGNSLAVTTPKATVRVSDAQVGIRAGKE